MSCFTIEYVKANGKAINLSKKYDPLLNFLQQGIKGNFFPKSLKIFR